VLRCSASCNKGSSGKRVPLGMEVVETEFEILRISKKSGKNVSTATKTARISIISVIGSLFGRNNASTSALCMRTACWDRVLPEKTSVVPLNPEKPYNLPMEYASYMSMGLVYAILGHTSSPVGGFVPPPHPVLGVRRK